MSKQPSGLPKGRKIEFLSQTQPNRRHFCQSFFGFPIHKFFITLQLNQLDGSLEMTRMKQKSIADFLHCASVLEERAYLLSGWVPEAYWNGQAVYYPAYSYVDAIGGEVTVTL